MVGVLLLSLVMLGSSNTSSSHDNVTYTNIIPSFASSNNVRDVHEEGIYTGGNTMCGKHDGKSYSWCYTDESHTVEEKCCIGECKLYTVNVDSKQWRYFMCDSGDQFIDCGSPGTRTVEGTYCRNGHPCGTHGYDYYWCYTDAKHNWHYCCHPLSICSANGGPNNHWCQVAYTYVGRWKFCKP
ncbi:hypothetical protein CHS0354_015096 [Potamilus streckersoni]|uniref:Uncharacterized protein n=1 Tax=Potamilus streckersoni TaxID=2493646 RepID=A0AAE0S2A2_9BIVA|nr:hypothetical protein CHS0354_015096 [Potamilus streckersoni]